VAGVTVFDDLGAEQERLEGILDGLAEAQWRSPSGAAGWTVADVVLRHRGRPASGRPASGSAGRRGHDGRWVGIAWE
jgi:hypothetical protein